MCPPRKIGHMRCVTPVITRLGQGDNDVTRSRQSLSTIEMARPRTTLAMRDDDQGMILVAYRPVARAQVARLREAGWLDPR